MGGDNVRRAAKSLPRLSGMLPYLTRSSIVGSMAGMLSGMTRAAWNLERTSAARVAESPGDGHVACLCKRGDAKVKVAARSAVTAREGGFIFAVLE